MRILRTLVSGLSWRTAIIALVLLSMLVPVIVSSSFFFPFVVPRNLFFRVVVEIAITTLVVALSVGQKTLDLRAEPIFWSLVAFLAAAFLSALFSPARDHSLFGDFERMGGVWAWLHLVLFFLILRTLRDSDWHWVLNGALAVSVFVSGKAIAEHFTLPFSSGTSDIVVSASSATLGNSGLLAAYLLFSVAVGAWLAMTTRWRALYSSASAVNLLALVYSENRSSVVGLVLGTIAGGAIFATLSARSRKRWIVPSMAAALALIVVVLSASVRIFPTSAITRQVPNVLQRLALTNPAGSDESRTMQWRAAIAAFKDRPLLGYGIENHNLVWSAHFDPGIYATDTHIFDRTHNQFLEALATTGLIGTIAFLSIWVAIGVTLVRAYRAGRLSASELAILAGLQVAYAIYLLFWFVDLNSTMLWIMIAALIASRGTVGSVVLETTGSVTRVAFARPRLAFASLAVLTASLYWGGYEPLRANQALARIDAPSGSVAETLAEFDVLAHPAMYQTAHAPMVMGEYMGSLRPRLAEMRAVPKERRMVERAFAESFAAFAAEIHRDTLNDRLYTHEGALLMDAAEFYGSPTYRQQAINAFHEAIDLSPRRIQQWLALARVYSDDRDYERAVVVLRDAVKTDPQLGEPRYRLAQAYIGAGQADSALALLQSSLKFGYVGAPETYLSMGKRLEFSGRSATAAKLYSDYLEAKYTESVWNRSQTIDGPVPATDIAVAAHLPLLYMRARESALAIKSAAALSAFDPSRAPIVDRFVSDVGSRRRSNWVAKSSLLPCRSGRSARSTDAATTLGACGVFRRKL